MLSNDFIDSPKHSNPQFVATSLDLPPSGGIISQKSSPDHSAMNIVLPTGKTFCLAGGIFSDDSDSECVPRLTCPPPRATVNAEKQDQVRMRSERRSKKTEDRRQNENTGDSVSLNWSWPVDSNPFYSSPNERQNSTTQYLTPPPTRISLLSPDFVRLSSDEDNTTVLSNRKCQICSSEGQVWEEKLKHTSNDDDFVISCVSCNQFVHVSCYGLQLSPKLREFQCDMCLLSVSPKCQLCFREGGILRKVISSRGTWVHPLCVLYTPELTLNVDHQMRPNDISCLDPDRKSLVCDICHKEGGCNVQCSHDDCFLSFHPYCGFCSKKQMIIRCIDASDDDDDCQFYYEVYCDKHKKRIRNLENIISSTLPLPERIEKLPDMPLPTGLTQLDESDDERVVKKRRRSINLLLTLIILTDFINYLHQLQ